MKQVWHTAWQAMDLVVKRDRTEVDRVAAADIERVIIVYRGRGATPGDFAFAVLRTRTHDLLFPPETGIAGRVHFERQAFWQQRRCVYWAPLAKAPLPRRLCQGALWILRQRTPEFARLPRKELDDIIASWPLHGPQTWDERKWERIERMRPLAALTVMPSTWPH